MPILILGILALVLGLWALNVITKVDPKIAARVTKAAGGLISLGMAVFLGLRGELWVAIPLGTFGLGLLGWMPFGPAGFSQRTQKSAGQPSRVNTSMLAMELDHDTGTLRGRFTGGPQAGRDLAGLDVASRALLLALLDRRDPTWTQHAHGDAAAGRGFAPSGKMTDEEAYQILGLKAGAGAEDVARAHRSLMKKLHPDQGGSTYLAARVNEAKETLLRRHR